MSTKFLSALVTEDGGAVFAITELGGLAYADCDNGQPHVVGNHPERVTKVILSATQLSGLIVELQRGHSSNHISNWKSESESLGLEPLADE